MDELEKLCEDMEPVDLAREVLELRSIVLKLETEKAMLQEWATSMLDGPRLSAGFCRVLLDYMKVLENKK